MPFRISSRKKLRILCALPVLLMHISTNLHESIVSSAVAFQSQPIIQLKKSANQQSKYSRPLEDVCNAHHEMPHEQAGAGGLLPERNAKHKNRKKKMKRKKACSQLEKNNRKSGPVSQEELAQHVSAMYVSGPGGVLKQAAKKREGQQLEKKSYNNAAHISYLNKLDGHPTLVLNADYQPLSVLPLSIWSWQETIKGVFSGKVAVVDVYPDISVSAVNVDVPLPSVVALTEYVRQPNQRPAFTRRNVFLRDEYTCQYCKKRYMTRDLSLDHVTPRCVGGRLEWDNTVTSCRKCNGQKGSTLPHNLRQIGMKLAREPRAPTKWELASNADKLVPRNVHPTWRPFLGMNMVPDEKIAHEENGSYFDESS